MEDVNMLAADCVVLSCCCQCMILQILIFILLKIPRKVYKKTREYAKKFRARKRAAKVEIVRYVEDSFRRTSSFRFDAKEFCCMEEIEGVFDDFSRRGEFDFGSFWGGGMKAKSLCSCLKEEEVDYGEVGCHLMELFGATNFSCQRNI